MGALYVFNPTTSPLALAINEEQVGSIRPCSASGYKPFFTRLNISRYEEPESPHLGENTLRVTFESEPRATYIFPFTLPRGFSIEEDVVAFATRGFLILTNQAATQLKPNPVPIPGFPLHPTDQQHSLQEEI
jgi:hypothetical protein